ncbi:hypothetical protein KAS79_04240 [Candidatus Parcubacteria bacterium]|nr:hypothetical protein [Candidatus Parcubacteria bacterium]
MSNAGRPSKYKPEFCKAIIDYFSVDHTKEVIEVVAGKNGAVEITKEVANDLPLFGMFANSISIDKSNMLNWASKKITNVSKKGEEIEEYKYPEFHNAYKKAKEMQRAMWIQNSLNNRYNSAFTIFMGKNMFGWRNYDEVKNTGEIKHTHTHETNLENYKKAQNIAREFEKKLYNQLKK